MGPEDEVENKKMLFQKLMQKSKPSMVIYSDLVLSASSSGKWELKRKKTEFGNWEANNFP